MALDPNCIFCKIIEGEIPAEIVFHESATQKLSDQISSHNVQNLLIIIGPEGGITDEELAAFQSAGAKVALMGRPILRSAHAGIAAVSAVSALLKVW